MYSLPQEIEVWYIVPAIRKELARLLTEKYKLSYEKTGALLGVGKAAVSQYLSNKRANKVRLNSQIKKEIRKSAEVISLHPKRALIEIQRILKIMRKGKHSCEVCRRYNKGILDLCGHKPEDYQ